VRELLASLGITPTAAGAATLSAELDGGRFRDVFGITATDVPGGHVSQDLKVPAVLSEYVESISVAPSHIYLQT
jgi:hypothetical protein